MFLISEDEIGTIIDMTEEICNTPGWVNEILPLVKKRMELINQIRSRPYTSAGSDAVMEIPLRSLKSVIGLVYSYSPQLPEDVKKQIIEVDNFYHAAKEKEELRQQKKER